MLRWFLPMVDVVLGLWLVVSPYALPYLGYAAQSYMTTNAIVGGALVAIVSFAIWLGETGYAPIFQRDPSHA
jgi:hypothetical protein